MHVCRMHAPNDALLSARPHNKMPPPLTSNAFQTRPHRCASAPSPCKQPHPPSLSPPPSPPAAELAHQRSSCLASTTPAASTAVSRQCADNLHTARVLTNSAHTLPSQASSLRTPRKFPRSRLAPSASTTQAPSREVRPTLAPAALAPQPGSQRAAWRPQASSPYRKRSRPHRAPRS